MTASDDPMVCAEMEGLLCLSDLPGLVSQPLCTPEQPCLHFFPEMGFRPAAWTQHRDQYGDRPILIVSGDEAYLAKYDMPFDGFAFLPPGLPLLMAPPAAGTPLLLASPTPGTVPGYGVLGFPGFPGFFGGGGGGGNNGGGGGQGNGGSGTSPTRPGEPGGGNALPPGGGTNTGSGDNGGQELPPLAAVPLSGSGMFLVMALAALMLKVGYRHLSGLARA